MITRSAIEVAWRTQYGPVWRSRAAAGAGAALIGLAVTGFAWAANAVQARMGAFIHREIWTLLVATPLIFVALARLTRRFAQAAAGSGIPQVIAAARDVDVLVARALVSVRTAFAKFALTLGGLMAGASVGREGPTVQIGATIMVKRRPRLRPHDDRRSHNGFIHIRVSMRLVELIFAFDALNKL